MELLPHPITEADLQKIMDWDPPPVQVIASWIKKAQDDLLAGIPNINVCDHIEMKAQIRKALFIDEFWDGTVVCRNCGLNMRRSDVG